MTRQLLCHSLLYVNSNRTDTFRATATHVWQWSSPTPACSVSLWIYYRLPVEPTPSQGSGWGLRFGTIMWWNGT